MLMILCLVFGGYCLGMGTERAILPGRGLHPAYHFVMGSAAVVIGVMNYVVR